MCKTTNTTLKKRTLSWHHKQHKAAVAFADHNAENLSAPEKEKFGKPLLRRWFQRLHRITVDNWTKLIKRNGEDSDDIILTKVINEDSVDSILMGSKGTLAYVLGWVLLKVSLVKTKLHQSAINKFLQFNTTTREQAANTVVPTNVIDSTEIQTGKMRRPGEEFYRFGCMLEALYVLNLKPSAAFAYKDELFMTIDKVAKESKQLEDVFTLCIPTSCNQDERNVMMELCQSTVLVKCSRMRARDALRRIKMKKIDNIKNRFTTRENVLNATATAAAAKEEAARELKGII